MLAQSINPAHLWVYLLNAQALQELCSAAALSLPSQNSSRGGKEQHRPSDFLHASATETDRRDSSPWVFAPLLIRQLL